MTCFVTCRHVSADRALQEHQKSQPAAMLRAIQRCPERQPGRSAAPPEAAEAAHRGGLEGNQPCRPQRHAGQVSHNGPLHQHHPHKKNGEAWTPRDVRCACHSELTCCDCAQYAGRGRPMTPGLALIAGGLRSCRLWSWGAAHQCPSPPWLPSQRMQQPWKSSV